MNDVVWNDLDYLLIDTPPGTSDEHISILENLKQMSDTIASAVLVTTPQVKFWFMIGALFFCVKTFKKRNMLLHLYIIELPVLEWSFLRSIFYGH